MQKSTKFASLMISVLLSSTLIACNINPSASGSPETAKTTNVFESAASTATESSVITETSATSETTAITETSESTSATASEKEMTPAPAEPSPTPAPSATTVPSSETSATEPSSTSKNSQVPKDLLAVYESEPQDKKNYIIYNNATGCTITSRVSGKGFEGTPIPSTDIYLTGSLPADALEFTIFYDERMNFTLRDLKGNFLVMTADGGLLFTDKPVEDWYQFWRMEKVDGGWIIVNTGSTSKLALQYDSGIFTAKPYYNNSSFVFNFYEVG